MNFDHLLEESKKRMEVFEERCRCFKSISRRFIRPMVVCLTVSAVSFLSIPIGRLVGSEVFEWSVIGVIGLSLSFGLGDLVAAFVFARRTKKPIGSGRT